MSRVSDATAEVAFSKLPVSVSHSDHLQPIDVLIWSYIDCHKRDYAKYDGTGMKWPIIKVEQISKDLRVKKVTVHQALERLRSAGFLVTERTSTGNRMILSEKSSLEDTLRGEKVRGWTFITLELIVSSISAQHILVLVFLDRKKESREYARSSQERIAKFLGKNIRTVRRIIADLKEAELIDSSPIPEKGTKIYQYEIFLRDFTASENEKAQDEAEQEARSDERKEYEKAADRITYRWIREGADLDFKEWASENRETYMGRFNEMRELVLVYGVENVSEAVDHTIEEYGNGQEVDFIFKILDELLDGIEIDG